MGERTEYPHGTFSYVDLSTSDQEGAKSFYSELFGWELVDQPIGNDQSYTTAAIDGKRVCGIYSGEQEGAPPHWNSYVTVDDVDALAPKVTEAGGTLVMEPFDVLDVGRMAVAQDPTGAYIAFWTPGGSIGAELVNVPGALTWNDLNTSDPDQAQPFYETLLGWKFEDSGDEGFPYRIISNGGRSNGGMRPFSTEERESKIPSHWLPYFACESVQETLERVEELEGAPVLGPVDVPNTGKFGVAQDPQGAFFAVFEGEFDD